MKDVTNEKNYGSFHRGSSLRKYKKKFIDSLHFGTMRVKRKCETEGTLFLCVVNRQSMTDRRSLSLDLQLKELILCDCLW